MLIDDLSATPSHEEDGEVIELPDLTLQLYAVDEKHRHIKFVIAQVLEERVLNRCRRLCGHFLLLRRRPQQDAA